MSISSSALTSTRQQYIDAIRALPQQLEAMVLPLSDAELDKQFESEWTVRQIVHHVADSHMSANFRFRKPLTEIRPELMVYDQEAFALLPDYRLPIAPSLEIIRGMHVRFVALLEALSEEEWQRTGVHSDWGEVTVEEVARRYAEHGQIHLDQIDRVLKG
jgi:hypothetical protein